MNWTYIGVAAALVVLAYAVDGRAQTMPLDGLVPCYSGPPSSAPRCGKVPPDAKPAEGRPYVQYGGAEKPTQCIEQQVTWEDPPGCRHYCRLSVTCGET